MAKTTQTVLITVVASIVVLFLLFPDAFKETTANITSDIREQIEAGIEEKVPLCFELAEDFTLSTTQEEIDEVLTECLDIACTFDFDDGVVQFFAEQNKQECIDGVTEAYNDELQRRMSN